MFRITFMVVNLNHFSLCCWCSQYSRKCGWLNETKDNPLFVRTIFHENFTIDRIANWEQVWALIIIILFYFISSPYAIMWVCFVLLVSAGEAISLLLQKFEISCFDFPSLSLSRNKIDGRPLLRLKMHIKFGRSQYTVEQQISV